jgi:hypothetical protein
MAGTKQGYDMSRLIVIPPTLGALGHVLLALGFDLWVSLSVKEVDHYALEFHTIHR